EFCRLGFTVAFVRRVHGFIYVLAGRHPAAGWIFWQVLFVQRCTACRGKSRTSLARRTRPRWQFRLAVLLPSRVESDFCRCTVARGCEIDRTHPVPIAAASYGHSA